MGVDEGSLQVIDVEMIMGNFPDTHLPGMVHIYLQVAIIV